MSKFAAITFVVFFLLSNLDGIVNTNDFYGDLHDRISSVIDDVLISLKINTKIIKSKTVEEYMAMHSFIQEVLQKNQRRYEEIRNKLQTTIDHKTVEQISDVNEVIDEMIREQSLKNISSIRNDTKPPYNDTSAALNGLADLVRLVNIKTKALTPNDFTLWSTNASQEVEGRRIFAGSSTGIARYPFMVSVHVAGQFVCAGSLLHESLALSAASCLMRLHDEPDATIQIRVGSDYITKMGHLVNVDRVISHPDFDHATLANNLVLIKTMKSLRFIHRKVAAVKYDKWDSVLRDAKDVVILGWGRRGPSDKSNDDQPLSRARLNPYDLEECKYIYTKEYVTDKTFCAGFIDRGEGACNHDGGGPALIGSLLAGVISFGSPRCGRVDAPTVFTRLSRYSDWIDSVLDSVTLAKGRLANTPTNFEVSESFGDGVGSGEMDAEKSDPESPREKLKRVFGVKDILRGPIDMSKDGKLEASTKAKIEEASEETDIKTSAPGNPPDILEEENEATTLNYAILNGPIDSSKSSLRPGLKDVVKNISDKETSDEDSTEDADETKSTDQIKLSDESEEITTSTPDEHSLLTLGNKQGESETFSDILKQLYESEILKDQFEDNEETTIPNVDSDSENKPATITQAKTTALALRMGKKVPEDEVPIEGSRGEKSNLNFGTENAKLKEPFKSLEPSQFDVQYQVEIKPIFVSKGKNEDEKNNSLIILTESGTTQRIEVKNAEILKNQLKSRMKALVQQMNSINISRNLTRHVNHNYEH